MVFGQNLMKMKDFWTILFLEPNLTKIIDCWIKIIDFYSKVVIFNEYVTIPNDFYFNFLLCF